MTVFQNQFALAILIIAFLILATVNFVYLLAYPNDPISPALRIGTAIGGFVMGWAGIARFRASRTR